MLAARVSRISFPTRLPYNSSPAALRRHGVRSFASANCGVGRFNHVAIAVPDLQASTAMYRDVLGAKVSEEQPIPEHGVTTVFVELENTKLELLHPLGKNSPIEKFLQRNKAGGIHHICLEVDDITEAVHVLKERGIKLLNEEPKIGAHGKPVVFAHPKSIDGVLMEFEQA